MIRLVALCISKLTPRVCCHCSSQGRFRFRKCLYYKEVVLYESVISVKALFNVVLLGLGRQRTEGKRAFSNELWGMSQPNFTRLSLFCFPLCLSLSHFVLCVLTRCLSWVLLLLLYNLSNLCSSLSFLFFCHAVSSLVSYAFLCLPPTYLPFLLWALHQVQLCDGKSMWQYPATTNTHPCQLMTLTGIPPCTSPWLPGWVPAESAVKSRTLAALPVQCTVEVTSATLDDTALADSATYALSLSSSFTVAFVRGRGREAVEWEMRKINWLYLEVKVFVNEGDGCLRRNTVLLSPIREDPISLFHFSPCFFTHSPKYLSVLIFQVLRQWFV